MSDRIWLTWETQRRNRTTSAALGARLFELDYPPPAALRYLRAIGRSLGILLYHRPQLLFAQNPSIILAALATAYGRLLRRPVVIDAHNAGIHPFDGRKAWANRLNRYILRGASLTVVTNEALATYVRKMGGRPAVLPDPLPRFQSSLAPPLASAYKVLFVCTWAEDEPYLEVLAAAERLPPTVRIYITGNSKGRETAYGKPLPPNVELTGFVSEQGFIELLYAADLVMDLTTREDCLVCGAYEGVAAGKPLLLSATEALRSYFYKGACYTDNSAADIARQIEEARARHAELRAEVSALQEELDERWRHRQEEIMQLLQQLEAGVAADKLQWSAGARR